MATPNRTPEPPQAPVPKPNVEPVLVPDEIDSAKWNMPPWGVVGIVLLVIFIGLGVLSYVMRPIPKVTGTVDDLFGVAMADNNVMVTAKLTLHNSGSKTMYIRNIKVGLKTDQGDLSDIAANAADFPRYFQAYPSLREHSITPVKIEDKIAPGEQERGSVIATFPVTLDQFNSRKSFSVTIEPYDQAPVTLTK